MKSKLITAVVIIMTVFSLCYGLAYAEEVSDFFESAETDEITTSTGEYDILPLADSDTDITVDAFALMMSKDEQYNTAMSSSYASRNAPQESVNMQSGALTLSQVDYSFPLNTGVFEIKRIFNSSAACDDIEWDSSSNSILKKESFYNEAYHLGPGWRFSFPMLEIMRDKDSSDTSTNITIILYHSESGAVYSLRPNYYLNSDGKTYSVKYAVNNHSLDDISVENYVSSNTKYIRITHKKQGVRYWFNEDGAILQADYYNGNTETDRVDFHYDTENSRISSVDITSNGYTKNLYFTYDGNNMLSKITISSVRHEILYLYYTKGPNMVLETVSELGEYGDDYATYNKQKYKFFTESRSLFKYIGDHNASVDSYYMKGIIYCGTNRLSTYEAGRQSQNIYTKSESEWYTSHQDYTVKKYDPANPKQGTYEKFGEKTTYEYPGNNSDIEISVNGTFYWTSTSNSVSFSNEWTGGKILYFKSDEPYTSFDMEINVPDDKTAVDVNGGNRLTRRDENDGSITYIYRFTYDSLPKYHDEYYTLKIEWDYKRGNDYIKRISIPYVESYILPASNFQYIEKFGSLSNSWDQKSYNNTSNTRGSVVFLGNAMYTWRRLHSELISEKQYGDFVLDTTIQFMEDPITDHTSAGVVFRVSDFNMGNNNFTGYYARISPETDNAGNQSTIAIYKMKADNNNPYSDLSDHPVISKSFSAAGLGTNCSVDKPYPMRVEAKGDTINVYVIDMVNPVLTYNCSNDGEEYREGSVGVRTFQRRAAFTSFIVAQDKYELTSTKKQIIDGETVETISETYDANSNLIVTKKDAGDYSTIVRYEYDENRMPKQISTYEYQKDANGSMVMVSSKSESYDYDDYGNLLEYRSPLANRVDSQSEDSDEVLTGEVTKYTYDDTWCLPLTKTVLKDDGTTLKTVYTLNEEKNQVISEELFENNTSVKKTAYTYDSYGYLTNKTVTEGSGKIATDYVYTLGDDYSVTEKMNSVVVHKAAYDGVNGNILSEEDTKGNVTTYGYDSNERLAKISYADGTSIAYIYGEFDYSKSGEVSQNYTIVTDQEGYEVQTIYDAYGRAVTKKSGGKNILDMNSSQLASTTYEYDERGNLISTTESDGPATTYSYDELGRMTSKRISKPNYDTVCERYEYSYQDMGSNVVVTAKYGEEDHETGSDTVVYDQKGRIIQQINGEGKVITTKYDYLDNKIAITDAGNHTTKFTYDALGRLLTSTKANGDVTSYTYNVYQTADKVTSAVNFYLYKKEKV